MKMRGLGRSGLTVSELGHGLWGMGDWSGSHDVESLKVLRRSTELGVCFFDTAQAYGRGRSDRLLGKLISQVGREKVLVGAKIAPKNWKWPGSKADQLVDVFPYDYLLESADEICRNIGVKTIDLLQLHVWHDAWADSGDWQRAVERLKSKKVITSFGISVNRWEPTNVLRALATGLVDVVQVIYNIFDQSPEDELFPFCRSKNIGVIARVPFDEGSLTGAITRDTRFPPDDWRAKYFGPENLGPTMDRIDALRAEFPGVKLSELALRFVLSQQAVGTTIAGMRSIAHLEENKAHTAKGPLSPEVLEKLRRHRWDRKVTPWAN